MSLEYAVKVLPSDFKVNEVQNLDLSDGSYSVYYLHKIGLRTQECVEKIALLLNVCTEDITYAGLKDEDGITGQFIAIYNTNIEVLNFSIDNFRRFTIRYLGKRASPFKIGDLIGNSFKIRIRNIEPGLLIPNPKHTFRFRFINYYDVQRFGIPCNKKVTHLIGKCILEHDYEKALEYLRLSGAGTVNIANSKISGETYFNNLDNRVLNFYLSAYDSFIWNKQIMDILILRNDLLGEYEKEGFRFLVSDLNSINGNELNSVIIRHERDEYNCIKTRKSTRFLYQDVICKLKDLENDDLNTGKNMLNIEFFLSSGCYATTVIDQLMYKIYHNNLD